MNLKMRMSMKKKCQVTKINWDSMYTGHRIIFLLATCLQLTLLSWQGLGRGINYKLLIWIAQDVTVSSGMEAFSSP